MITTKPLRCILGFHSWRHVNCRTVADGEDGSFDVYLIRHTKECTRCGEEADQMDVEYHPHDQEHINE